MKVQEKQTTNGRHILSLLQIQQIPPCATDGGDRVLQLKPQLPPHT